MGFRKGQIAINGVQKRTNWHKWDSKRTNGFKKGQIGLNGVQKSTNWHKWGSEKDKLA